MATTTHQLTHTTRIHGGPGRYQTPTHDGWMVEPRMVSTPGTGLETDTFPEIEQAMDLQTYKKIVECGMGHVGAME